MISNKSPLGDGVRIRGGMAFARVFVPFPPSCSSRPSLLFLPVSHLSTPFQSIRNLTVSASSSAMSSSDSMEIEAPKTHRWRPMCLYYTQGRCVKMDDATHLEKFNHNYSADLKVNATCLNRLRPQDLDYLLVLDLEGRVEILEFPVLMIDAKTMEFIDSFHRFVRPSLMSKQKIMEYIEGKYGRFGVDRVWHDTAIPFKDVLKEFEVWMTNHHLWKNDQGGSLNRAAFVTCGNWDLKTMIPKQCKISKMKMPLYFMEWINLKDIYLNFYKRTARGMMMMMRQLEIPVWGSHHLGIDDAKNIARVLQHMLADGVVLQITARRSTSSPDEVQQISIAIRCAPNHFPLGNLLTSYSLELSQTSHLLSSGPNHKVECSSRQRIAVVVPSFYRKSMIVINGWLVPLPLLQTSEDVMVGILKK